MVEGRMLEEDAIMRSRIGWKDAVGGVAAASIVLGLLVAVNRLNGDDTTPSETPATGAVKDASPGKAAPAPPKLPEPKGATRLSKEYPIWIDMKEKTVIVE